LSAALTTNGWAATDQTIEPMFGTLSFSRGEQSLSIVYVDPGILPAEFTITAAGGPLDITAEMK
jgi:hypothetical protein